MKKLFATFAIAIFSVMGASAQGQRIFLFEEFKDATLRMKNGSRNKAQLNYDANNGKVYFMSNGEMMEMTNLYMVDSVHVGRRVFVQQKGDLVELFNSENGTISIKWRIHKIHEGYVGAFGNISQVASKKVQLGDHFGMDGISGAGGGMYNGTFGVNNDKEGGVNLDIWRQKTENTYTFTKNDKVYTVSRLKQLYKLFPQQKAQIQTYVKEQQLDLMSAEKAVKIINYVMGL